MLAARNIMERIMPAKSKAQQKAAGAALSAERGETKTVLIDATHLKAHRTETSLGVKKGGVDA